MADPTQEEKDRALKWARNPSAARSVFMEKLQRVLLHATAELARAEERIRELETILSRAKERILELSEQHCDSLLVSLRQTQETSR